jgi:hypothetical protein
VGQLYLWVPWIVVLAIVGVLLYRRRNALEPGAIAREVAIVVGAYAVYYVVRGSTHGSASTAIDHARRIIDIEEWLRIYWEPAWQSFFTSTRASTLFFNWVYIWWHWPVIIVVALWLFLERPGAYYTYRWAFLVSGGIALIFFAATPVAPPRLATPDIVDTISLHSSAYRSYEAPAFVNQYAAFPSLHFAWSVLASIAIFTQTRVVALRIVAILSPVAVLLSIVATGNHFIIDAAAGVLLAVASLAAVELVRGFSARLQRGAYYARASEEAPERSSGKTVRPRRDRR